MTNLLISQNLLFKAPMSILPQGSIITKKVEMMIMVMKLVALAEEVAEEAEVEEVEVLREEAFIIRNQGQ
jgi:hypothetical protein